MKYPDNREQLEDMREYLRKNKVGTWFTAEDNKKKRHKYKLLGMDEYVDMKKFTQKWMVAKNGDYAEFIVVETQWFIERNVTWIENKD